jgi:3-oxoacyl-[acyl-carrier protein] reductase
MNRLKGKICIVTGVSEKKGIGYGTAKVFAREGATVICVVRRSLVYERVKELTNDGYDAVGYVADLSKEKEVDIMVSDVMDKYGKVDVLVNVAGGGVEGVRGNIVDVSEEGWDRVMASNMKTCLFCTRAVLPGMMKRKKGKIVNVSSVTGPFVSMPGSAAYSASKGAVSGFTRALALDVAEYGITVNSICPGWIDSGAVRDPESLKGTIPMKRLGSSEEVGYLALFLATKDSDYITGQDIVIDGGNIIQERKGA